jgi:FkbM family methyltransferase
MLNGVQDRVFPIPLPVGEKTGVATLLYNTLHPGQSRHRFVEGTADAQERGTQYRQSMLVLAIDSLVEQFHLPRPNHIKLDVDGAELGVLRGALKTLADPGLRSILIEIDDALSESAVKFLSRSGFHLDTRFKRHHDKATQVWYGVFRRA